MKSVIEFQILDKAVCMSFYANALKKGINSFPPPVMDKDRPDSLALVKQPV